VEQALHKIRNALISGNIFYPIACLVGQNLIAKAQSSQSLGINSTRSFPITIIGPYTIAGGDHTHSRTKNNYYNQIMDGILRPLFETRIIL